MTRRHGYDPAKRVLDVILASILLLLSLPVQAVVAVLIRIRLGPPVLFRQQRPGLDEKPFELTKFRTMRVARPDGAPEPDAARLTAFGRRLRSLSLDELPTLLNVIRGDMSLVGPRPLMMAYLDRYSPEQARRHEVRPGMTGLAQVSGRNALTWEEKFELDIEYVDTRSLRRDLAILARTVGAVLSRSGVTPDGQEAMPEFKGDTEP
jgi:lipopolysaccharide/colanic/teichoic acid biosynthesis glycosyltransferase